MIGKSPMIISVIIPVYNTKKYLNKCIDSILNQTYKNIELILVDDGSNDGSGEICDTYADTDNRIKVIHQKNAGVSSARNTGIDIAKGDFITFVDSDDWIEVNAYEIFIHILKSENIDIVVSNKFFVNDDKERKINIPDKIYYSSDEAKELLLKLKFPTSLCMCIYSSLIIKNEYLNENIYYWEDFEYQYRLICKANKIAVITTASYHYRKGSITHSIFNCHKLTCLQIPRIIKDSMTYTDANKDSIFINLEIFFILELASLSIIDRHHEKSLDHIIHKAAGNVLQTIRINKYNKINKILLLFILSIFPKLYNILFNFIYKIKELTTCGQVNYCNISFCTQLRSRFTGIRFAKNSNEILK